MDLSSHLSELIQKNGDKLCNVVRCSVVWRGKGQDNVISDQTKSSTPVSESSSSSSSPASLSSLPFASESY